jgi:glycosyltransferase involved in cell wall biosynthesis
MKEPQFKFKKKTNKKIHISFFIGSLEIGGTEKQFINIINSLDQKKFKIDLHLLSSKKGQLFKELESNITVFLPKFKFKSFLKHIFNFIVSFFRIRRTKPEIIHCFLPHAYLIAGLIGFLNNHKNIIMSRRSLNNYQRNFKLIPIKKIELFLHKRIKFIIVNARAVRENIINEGAPEKIVKLIYNGFIKPENEQNVLPDNFKKKLGIKKNTFVFLVLANLIPYKNHKLVINAVDELRKFVKTQFKVIFLGSGKNEYKQYLKSLIKEKKIENYFIFKNRTKYIKKFLDITNAGISSSLEEGLSNSLIELISNGITTIATNVGGNSEITNNRNGFLIESNNKDQLVKAMKTILSNKNLLKRKSLQSKKDSKKFGLNEMVKNHTIIYENLITN